MLIVSGDRDTGKGRITLSDGSSEDRQGPEQKQRRGAE